MRTSILEQVETVSAPPAKDPIRHILIVDDDSNFRRGVQRLFYVLSKEVSFHGYEASGGEEALSILRQYPIDCVLLDYRMSGGDGLEWLAQIVAFNREVPVVMVTGSGGEEIAVAALKSGAADYLVKGSITSDSLRRSLLNAIEMARMRATVERQRQELMEAERQKAMIQSLGAACHHLGQPATTLQCCLELLQRQSATPEIRALVEQSAKAMADISAILHDLQRATAFRTTTYRAKRDGEAARCDESILDIYSRGESDSTGSPKLAN